MPHALAVGRVLARLRGAKTLTADVRAEMRHDLVAALTGRVPGQVTTEDARAAFVAIADELAAQGFGNVDLVTWLNDSAVGRTSTARTA